MKRFCFIATAGILLILSVYLILDSFVVLHEKYGSIRICVKEGFGEMPIENARVVIPEANAEELTDADGYTESIKVPILRDKHYDGIKRQNYGRITVIVYADGFIPYGVFFVHVKENVLRTVDILLFEDDGSLDSFVVIEAPDEKWAKELIREYE